MQPIREPCYIVYHRARIQGKGKYRFNWLNITRKRVKVLFSYRSNFAGTWLFANDEKINESNTRFILPPEIQRFEWQENGSLTTCLLRQISRFKTLWLCYGALNFGLPDNNWNITIYTQCFVYKKHMKTGFRSIFNASASVHPKGRYFLLRSNDRSQALRCEPTQVSTKMKRPIT